MLKLLSMAISVAWLVLVGAAYASLFLFPGPANAEVLAADHCEAEARTHEGTKVARGKKSSSSLRASFVPLCLCVASPSASFTHVSTPQ